MILEFREVVLSSNIKEVFQALEKIAWKTWSGEFTPRTRLPNYPQIESKEIF